MVFFLLVVLEIGNKIRIFFRLQKLIVLNYNKSCNSARNYQSKTYITLIGLILCLILYFKNK
jgi:hypothetical protein